MRVRGILPTNRPDDIPLALWVRTYHGQREALDRAMARLWIASFLRPVRRLTGVSGKK